MPSVGPLLGGARFGPLRSQGFRALYTAHAVSVVGDGLVSVALAFAVLDLTGSASDLGLVLLARLVPMVFLYVAGGVWADRLPRHRLMVASHALAFVAQASSGALLIGGHASIASLAALQALHGVATAFYRPASSGILPRLVRREELQQANALLWGALAVGGVLGPALAGIVVATAGPGWALLGDACSFALSALLLLRLRRHDLGTAPARERFWTDVRVGWHEVRSRTWIWLSIVYFSLFQLLYLPAIFVLGPVLAADELDGAKSWAVITAGFGLGSVLGDLLLLRWRPRFALRVAALMLVGSSCQAAFIGSGLGTWAIAGLEVLAGICVTGTFTLWETSLQEHIPDRSLSRVSSYDYLTSAGLIPLGNLASGAVSAAFGVQPTLLGMSVVGLTAAALVAAVPAVRTLPRGATS